MSSDEVFILRFWLEEAGVRDQMQWRAQVRNVNTRQRQVADGVDSAFGLIANRLHAALSTKSEE